MTSSNSAAILEALKERVREFPQTSGVYLMKSQTEKIIYVGKAKNLRNRVRSYLGDSKDLSPKTKFLVSHIRSIEFILTKTEVEAFLLEASLIKKHRPKYNIALRDDKSYPYIRLSAKDDFPRFYLSRRVVRDGSIYYGPFTRGGDVYETIRFLNRTFMIRDCRDAFFRSRKRPCMTHQIGRCTAPCVSLVSKEQYNEDVKSAELFLRGKNKSVVKDLTQRMKRASDEERFEAAAKLRDSIESIKAVLERQSVVFNTQDTDQDAIGFFGDERGTTLVTFHVRKGRVLGWRPHFFPMLDTSVASEDPREWLISFVNQYYEDNIVPDEVLLPIDVGGDLFKLLEAVLKERKQGPVKVRYPTDEIGSELLQMADQRAHEEFKNYVSKSEKKLRGLEEIQERLGLPKLPRRIECYDISNFQGAESVASQVVFEDGVPAKDHYRRYKIKTVKGANDFESMKEVLKRRLAHDEYDIPQLIVVDGGKGQLGMAVEILKELGFEGVPVVGLAKARTQGTFQDTEISSSEERVFLPGRQNPVVFAANSEALHILVGIRDEAHRFAIMYHRKLREVTTLESELDSVVGLGEKKKQALLKKFPSIEAIKGASIDELTSVQGLNRVLAERIQLHLSEGDANSAPEGDPEE